MWTIFKNSLVHLWASLIAQLVKNPPAMRETPVQFLGQEDRLEKRWLPLQYSWASLVAQLVKNLPATRETWVWSLDWEDPLEKGKATHSSILAWRIPWTIGNSKSIGLQSWQDFHFHCICYNIASVLFFCVFLLQGMWDPSSPIRDRTFPLLIGRWSLNHWTIREVPTLYNITTPFSWGHSCWLSRCSSTHFH